MFYLYQLLGLGVYNLCDRQKNMSVEQNEDWSTRRKACPITTLSTKNYMESKAGLRDTEECEIFISEPSEIFTKLSTKKCSQYAEVVTT